MFSETEFQSQNVRSNLSRSLRKRYQTPFLPEFRMSFISNNTTIRLCLVDEINTYEKILCHLG